MTTCLSSQMAWRGFASARGCTDRFGYGYRAGQNRLKELHWERRTECSKYRSGAFSTISCDQCDAMADVDASHRDMAFITQRRPAN